MQNRWTDEQLRQAFYLYCTLPFGQLHSKTPAIVHLAARLGRTPSAVAMKLVNFASLDPVIASSGRKGLSGASANDKKIWAQCHADWTGVAEQYEATDDASTLETKLPFNAGADVMRTTKARIGQQFFRTSVLANYANRCCISGLNIPALLVASHISPWAVDSHNRLNPSNGLCLSSLHDAAFDQGLITLDLNNCVMVSTYIQHSTSPFVAQTLSTFAGARIQLPAKFAPNPVFTQYHREMIFKG